VEYHAEIKTITLKLPESLASWLDTESKRLNQPKSALVRELLLESQQRRGRSPFDLASDLCGCVDTGLGDLSYNKKRLKGFGQ
jgi:hypothetical protein